MRVDEKVPECDSLLDRPSPERLWVADDVGGDRLDVPDKERVRLAALLMVWERREELCSRLVVLDAERL